MSLFAALGAAPKEPADLKEAKKENNFLKREVARLKEELKKERLEKKKLASDLRKAETSAKRKDEEIKTLKKQIEIDKARLSSVEGILQSRSHLDGVHTVIGATNPIPPSTIS